MLAKSRCCRFCATYLRHTFVDLGTSPLANAYVDADKFDRMEPFYPLHAYVCENCHLVQLDHFKSPDEIFSDYAYFSSYSDTWLEHAREFVNMTLERFELNRRSQIVEIASNDGYLLQYFAQQSIPVLGIEPAANVAETAIEKGIPTRTVFFSAQTAEMLAKEGKRADLLVANNVLAHVPDINDFVKGLQILLKPDGVITMEFHHLMQLMAKCQFDTIYHEHYSYLSCLTVQQIIAKHGLTLFDVEELNTHGGSLRVYVRNANDASKPVSRRVADLIEKETAAGLKSVETYAAFHGKVSEIKRELLSFLISAKRAGKRIAGYGAPAKGNTLLNYCGIRRDFVDFTVDRSPHKQGLYLPGTRIPIFHPDKIEEAKPDYVLILPWNIKDEIMHQMSHVRGWGAQFIVPLPHLKIC